MTPQAAEPRTSPTPASDAPWRLASLVVLLLAACSRLSGDGGGPTDPGRPVLPPLGESVTPTTPTLVSAIGAPASVALRWVRGEAAPPAPEGEDPPPVVLALFFGSTPADVYLGAPLVDPLEGETLVVEGLADGVPLLFGLARVTESGFLPSGELLSVVPGAPLYVDAAAPASGADGLTPATAFPDPFIAVLTAFANGGGNVWLKAGDYGPLGLPMFPGVSLYGGFGADFAFPTGAADAPRSVLRGFPNQPVIAVQDTLAPVIIESVVVDGAAQSTNGIDVTDSVVEFRGVTATACLRAGFRINATDDTNTVSAKLVDCSGVGNLLQGISLSGASDLTVRACNFDNNAEEGLDCNDIVSPDGRSVSARLIESRFSGNGGEGADIDLAAPLFGGIEGGLTRIRISGCLFELNALDGLFVDIDFELEPLWAADVLLQGVTARGNGFSGLHLDLDGRAPTFLHRVRCNANGGEGLLVTSETFAGLAVVSASDLSGNLGHGLRSTGGNSSLLLSHSVLAGNSLGGVRAETVPAGVVSSIFWLQPTPVVNTLATASLVLDDPTEPTLARLPTVFGVVTGFNAGVLTLSPAGGQPQTGDAIELQDDGVPRSLTGFQGSNGILLDPTPLFLATPARLWAYESGDDVIEDYRVLPGSVAEGAAMVPAGAAPRDAGPLGAPDGGIPGQIESDAPPVFRLGSVDPPLADGLGSGETFALFFEGGVLDPASVNGTSVVLRNAGGTAVGISPFAQDDALLVPAPAGGWPPGGQLELQETLASTDGRGLGAPLVLPLLALP